MLRVRMGMLCMLFALLSPAFAGTEKYRAMWREDPTTTMVLGWNQVDGSSPVVYYDMVDHGTNTGAYAYAKSPDRSVSYFGMNNRFARLTGLTPNTTYYFVIGDSNSISNRMKFRTAPADDTPFTVISGGDSRNNWDVRIEANQMVAKLKPLFVAFGGDMTSGDTSSEWQAWMDHWQNTITSDGRLIPIVAARGNHEDSNASVQNMFDSPHNQIYFALTFGDNILRTYTLNSEDVEGGNQATWLENDLAANQNVSWRFAQYHKPMRPHVSSKSEGSSEYNAWAQLFYDYNMDLVVECDSHMVKSTWPVRPSSGSGSDEGFIRDDENGTVYVGEGTWGAPLRSANDNKTWTRESGSFNQFKWAYVTRTQVQVKTIQYENVASVGEVNESNPYAEPSGLQTWGAVIELAAASAPSVSITAPADGAFYNANDPVSISASASSPVGSITKVSFYVDGNLLSEDTSSPYTASWTASGNGSHTITAEAHDDIAQTSSDSVTVQVGVATISRRVASSSDDAEENSSGGINLTSSDLELIQESTDQTVGMRFTNITIPQGANITDASIQFTVDESSTGSTSLVFRGQDTGNASSFSTGSYNISNRATTGASVSWNPAGWSSVGASGADQRTPNLASVIQEIVDRGDWNSGNALAIIVTGVGRRTAESYNGVSSSAPQLSITYSAGGGGTPTNNAPNANFSYTTNNLSASFTNTSSDSDGSIVSWSWNFGDGSTSSSQNPNHTYSTDGTYAVSLSVTDDDGATDTHTASVTVQDTTGGTPTTISVRVSSSSDDAEERISNSSMYRSSSDLELVEDGSRDQYVGVRFRNLNIPTGATILDATIQFTVDETDSRTTNLVIYGQDAGNPSSFGSGSGNISSRSITSASVNWNPPAWTSVGQAGAAQRTPDLSAIVQEIVNRGDWNSGNSMVFLFDGSGERTAESYNGSSSRAPLLEVTWQ